MGGAQPIDCLMGDVGQGQRLSKVTRFAIKLIGKIF